MSKYQWLGDRRPLTGKMVFVCIAFGFFLGIMITHILSPLLTSSLRLQNMQMGMLQNQLNDAPMTVDHGHDYDFYKGSNSIAETLAHKIKVLCWITTRPQNHKKKAQHVKATWGKRCSHTIFMSSQNDTDLPAIGLPIKEGRQFLWEKTKLSLKYMYDHYYNEADWFLKADDDTYVVVENLRFLLSHYNASDPVFIGCRLKHFTEYGYMSGGAGYVLSKEALRRLAVIGLPNAKECDKTRSCGEDVELGLMLQNLEVQFIDSRDSLGRARFLPMTPQDHLYNRPYNPRFWYWRYTFYKASFGMNCCSDTAISFHYVRPLDMYVLDYLVYRLRPSGVTRSTRDDEDRFMPPKK